MTMVSDDGCVSVLHPGRWMHPPTPEEDELLERALAPALDVGCGPGRIALALCRRGIMAVGVDTAPAAAHLARARGAPVLERSIFDRLPGSGRWGSAILLDGNLGIGGDPIALLRRLAGLLRSDGRVLVELDPPGRGSGSFRARLDDGWQRSAWFPWARVAADDVGELAAVAGLRLDEVWAAGDRWFACLVADTAASARSGRDASFRAG